MAQFTGKGSLIAGVYWCVGVLRRAARASGIGYQRHLGWQFDGDGAISTHLHRADIVISWTGLPQALLGATGLRTR